jgi:transposase
LNAHLVFLDESGLLLAPLVRRTWAPRGETPVFYQRGRHREKVSIIGALTVSPKRRRVGLYFSLIAEFNVDAYWLVAFLTALAHHLRGPVILVWDRLNVHLSAVVRHFLERHPRFHVELLPAYAPELNPVETVWSYLKLNPLANFAPSDVRQLARVAARHTRQLQRRRGLIRSFCNSSPLSS